MTLLCQTLLFEYGDDSQAILAFGSFLMVILVGCAFLSVYSIVRDLVLQKMTLVIPSEVSKLLPRESLLRIFWLYNIGILQEQGDLELDLNQLKKSMRKSEISDLETVLASGTSLGLHNSIAAVLYPDGPALLNNISNDEIEKAVLKEFLIFCGSTSQ
eukprot:TRINITY_DN9848_c0_g1_i2.p2 TRINITY_DN9848_c0_g1~~TRINITY_DN9848_c0_g1_i2.p2  ORF type:complete len:158 (+),score=45.31 TRINITY_DN9848_c0_g1_i2:872-1345(+)